jgi:NADPH:quinone reductase-like Zn-dependent oxidoreductase
MMAEAQKLGSAVPKTMQVAAIDRFGEPTVLSIHTLPVPIPDADEVLIAVDTAGVGSWDADIRNGWFPSGKPHFPLVLGVDGAGIVAAVGSRVRRFEPGERVYAYAWNNPKGGFYAEYAAVSAKNTAHVPEHVDLKHAGAVPTTGLTALQGIDDVLHVRKGESVIIHGASGGVGSLALQFAKWRGARVFATARGNDGLAFVRRLGADLAVDGQHEDIAAAARGFASQGIDAMLALAGGDALDACLAAIRKGGRVAYPNGVEPEPKKPRGVELTSYDATAGVREFERLSHAIEAAKLKIEIAGEYSLADAAKAHQRVEAGHVLGKVVLRIR